MRESALEFLDRPEVASVLFFPRPGSGMLPVDGHVLLVEVATDVSLEVRVHIAQADAPVLVLFHGNGELAEDYDALAPLFTDRNITLVVTEYRGYGASGGMPSARAMLQDAVALWEALPGLLPGLGVVSRRWFVMGRSLGSAPALEVAVQAGASLRGLIIDSGFATTLQRLRRIGAVPDGQECDGFANIRKIGRISVPTLIIHGAQDELVPPSEGELLHARAPARHKRLLLIPGGTHNNLFFHGREAYFAAVDELVGG